MTELRKRLNQAHASPSGDRSEGEIVGKERTKVKSKSRIFFIATLFIVFSLVSALISPKSLDRLIGGETNFGRVIWIQNEI